MKKRIYTQEEIDDCKKFYIEQEGKDHKLIVDKMKAKGWKNFNDRVFYTRQRRGGYEPGWAERFGWNEELEAMGIPVRKKSKPKRYDFQAWLENEFPDWEWRWKYQKHLYKRLAAVTGGGCRRLMIFLPPRHGKSELVTVRYVAWRLMQDPKLNVILGSYNQKLANRFSRKIRRIVSLTQGREGTEAQKEEGTTEKNRTKPEKKKEKRAESVEEWETSGCGGVRAVGVGGGVTGFGANLIVVDDPIKSRAEAESETYRENVWDWFNDDLYTRLEPDAAIILIQTRWHEDDLAGRLLKEMKDGGEHWDVISLPALAEATEKILATNEHEYTRIGNENEEKLTTGKARKKKEKNPQSEFPNPKSADALGRKEGEALCPQRFDKKALLRIKAKLGSYGFSALYQQNPIPAGGGAFQREWFRQVIDEAPKGLKWARGYDLAVSTKTSADYTASFRCSFDRSGNLYIADGFRKRIEYPEQRRFVIDRMKAELDTRHGVEAALHGQALVQDLRREREIRFRPLKSVKVDGDKLTRALAWANLAEEGKVILVRGPWIADFLEEVCRFTGRNDRHDDQIDAVSLAVRLLSEKDKRLYGF